MEKITKISTQTLIPIGLMMTILGGVWFFAKLDSRVTINTGDIVLIKEEIIKMKDSLYSIDKNVYIMTSILQKNE